MAWQTACSSYEKLEHIVLAHRYWHVLQAKATAEDAIANATDNIEKVEEALDGLKVNALTSTCSARQ